MNQTQEQRPVVRREDYRPYPYLVHRVELRVDLDPSCTRVTARLELERRLGSGESEPLVLAGQGVKLVSLRLDGLELPAERYLVDQERLVVDRLPARCVLESEVEIDPAGNTALEGLYMSNGMYRNNFV